MSRRVKQLALALGLVASGTLLLAVLLWDATLLVRTFGLDPGGSEAIVAVAGLAASAGALVGGVRRLLRPLALDAG